MIRLLLLIPFILSSVSAREVKENVVVRQLKWMPKSKLYRVAFQGKAGVYYASKKDLQCLRDSIKKSTSVSISFSPKNHSINHCQQ